MQQKGEYIRLLLENEYVKIEIENNIVIGRFKAMDIDLDTARKIVEYRIIATEGKTFPLLADMKCIKSSTKAARDFFASESGCQGLTSTALLIDSPLGSMIANFYISINKPLRPVRVFTDEAKAKKWLAQYLGNKKK